MILQRTISEQSASVPITTFVRDPFRFGSVADENELVFVQATTYKGSDDSVFLAIRWLEIPIGVKELGRAFTPACLDH